MTITLTYADDLSRVRIAVTGLDPDSVTANIERSTDGVRWTFVRGGEGAMVTATNVALDDYEFPDATLTTYRVTGLDVSGDTVETDTETITVELDVVWLKSLTRPFLNLPVVLQEFGAVERTARNGVFAVSGRSFPIAVTDVRSGRQQEIRLLTADVAERRDLDLVLSSGDPVFVHSPEHCGVDTMYAVVGDASYDKPSRTSIRRIFTLPLTEVAPPHHSIVGSTVTWQGIINAFADWSDTIAGEATWADLIDRIGDPSDVIVG